MAAKTATRSSSARGRTSGGGSAAGVERVHIHELADRQPARAVRATYDAAQTTTENAAHWAAADALSANAAHSAMVRSVLRQRARYEWANNSYCRGMLLTLANEIVGTGPKLQVIHENREAANQLEREFMRWARAIKLSQKLRTMHMTKARDGECFGVWVNNPKLPTPVKLDLMLVEADSVTTPDFGVLSQQLTDGIVYDAAGNPVTYHILLEHPGETNGFGTLNPLAYREVAAEHVVHRQRVDRPGQRRNVPEITPALHLFALLRRYTLAVLGAAETAANIAAVIKSTYTVEDPAALVPLDPVEIVRRAMLTLPEGYEMQQFKAEQPTSTFDMFVRALLQECGRVLVMPYNIVAGNSGGHNYASGQLDYQMFDRLVAIEREEDECDVLDVGVAKWTREASRIAGYLALPDADETLERAWLWQGRPHQDPNRQASAHDTALANHSTTLAEIYAAKGQEWEQALEQRAKELAAMKRLKIPLSLAVAGDVSREDEDDDDDEAQGENAR